MTRQGKAVNFNWDTLQQRYFIITNINFIKTPLAYLFTNAVFLCLPAGKHDIYKGQFCNNHIRVMFSLRCSSFGSIQCGAFKFGSYEEMLLFYFLSPNRRKRLSCMMQYICSQRLCTILIHRSKSMCGPSHARLKTRGPTGIVSSIT